MFKKIKDKITEEVKSAPRNLFQPSVQQPLQAVAPHTSNESFSSDLLDKSSSDIKTFEHAASPELGGFTSIDLRSPPVMRKSSLIFPVNESPPYLQSDLESASEVESSLCSSQRLGHITKESLYSSYQQVHSKYQKYKGRFVEMSKAYKKLEAVMSESQDKILRKNAELKEQCQLEQKAKAHLEEMLRNDLEEKDHIINTLNTKINLLKDSEEGIATVESGFDELSKTKTEDDSHSLIEFNDSNNAIEGKPRDGDIQALKCKLIAAERKMSEQETNIKQLEETLQKMKQKDNSSSTQLLALRTELQDKTNEINQLKEKQDAEKVTLAETKMNLHKELESKDTIMADLKRQISQLNEEKLGLHDQINNMKADWKEKDIVTGKKLETVDLLRQELQKKMEIETSLHASLEAKHKECLEMKQKLKTTEPQSLSFNQKLEAAEKGCSDFKQKLEATEEKCLEFKQKFEASEEKCSELKQKLESSEKECLESQHNMEELENTLETLRTSNDEMIRNLERELSNASSDNCIEQELNQLREKLKKHEEQSESEKRELKTLYQKEIEEEKSKYNDLIKQIENSLKSKENEIVRTLEEKDQTIYKLENKIQTLLGADKTKAQTTLKIENSKLKEKLNALNEEIVALKKVTDQLENSLKEKDQTISEMTNEREKMNGQIKELKGKTEETGNSVINSLQDNIKLLKKGKHESNVTYQANIEDLKIENSNLHQELVLLNTKQAEVNDKYEALVVKCKLLETIEINLNRTIEDLKSGKESGNSEAAKLKSKMLETFEENKILKDQFTSVESERLKDAALVEKQKQTINILKGDITTLETDISHTLQKKLDSKTKKVTELEDELHQVKTELTIVKSALDVKNEQEKVLTKKLTELLPELEKLQTSIDAKTSENNKLKNEWNQKDTQLKSIAKKLIYVHVELKSTKDLHRNICTMLKNMDDTISKVQEIDNVLEQMKSKARDDLYEALRKKEEEYKTQISTVNTLNEELKENITELIKEKENNEIKHEGYMKKIEHYENILNEKKNEFNVHQDLEHQYKANIEQLELDNSNLVNEISDIKKEYDVKIEKYQYKIKEVQEELNSEIDAEIKLKKELENIKTINQEQEDKVRTLVTTEMEVKFNKEKKKLEVTIEKLNADMKKCQSDLKLGVEEKMKLRSTVESKEKEISSLQEHRKEIEDRYSVLSEQLAKLSTENEILCEEKELLQEKHDQLSNQITTLRESCSKSKESMEKINSLTKENGQLVLEREELSKFVATLQKEEEKKSSSQNLEMKQLQDELVNYKKLYHESNSKSTKYVEKISALSKEKTELVSEIENLRISIVKLQDNIDNKTSSQNQTSAQMKESQNELKKLEALNTELSLKSKDLLEKITKLTKDYDELASEKDHLGKLVIKLQEEIEENKVSVPNSNQIRELQNELASCRNLNAELKNSREKFRASVDKLANYLNVPLIRPNSTSPNQVDIDIDAVIERFKTLKTQVKNKEKNDSDFFMLTLEEELKKERLLNTSLEKDLKVEKDKLVKMLESSNKHQESFNNLNIKQLQTSCSKVKNELRHLKDFSIEQLDELTKDFITMKMNLIQGVINFNSSSMSNNLIQNDSNANSEALKKTLDEEHKAQIRKLVSEFKQELAAKEKEIHALESKQFDRRDAEEFYISNELKRSIMNLEEENQTLGSSLEELTLKMKEMKTDHSVEISKLLSKHNEDMKALETKWKEWMRNKLEDKEEKFKEEIDALSNEWQHERKEIFEVDTVPPMANYEELESRREEDSNVHKDLAKLTLELSQAKKQHKEEVKELRRLLNLGKQGGEEDSTSECEGEAGGDAQKGGKEKNKLGTCLELEYLRNVLFEYMMGKEPLVLARVLAAIVKFDPEHTAKVLQREEQKVSMVSQLSHTYMKFS